MSQPAAGRQGSDDDILIAGFTDYDLDKDSLLAIMAEWTSPSFDADRVAAITAGNGVSLLDATTVYSNGGNNVLLGNAGFDLFFANSANNQTDADPEAEIVVAISRADPTGGKLLKSSRLRKLAAGRVRQL